MHFLKTTRRFDFLYGGIPLSALEFSIMQNETDAGITTIYTFADGLKVTNIAKKCGDVYEWTNWFENTSDIISLPYGDRL